MATVIGVAEVQKSLATRDFADARRRCILATKWFSTTMEQFRLMTSPTRSDLERAARVFFSGLARDLDHPRNFPEDGFREAVAYNVHLSEESITEFDRQLIGNQFDSATDRLAERLLASLNVRLADLDAASALLARQLATRAAREESKYLVHMLGTPANPYVTEDKLFVEARTPDGATVAVHDAPSVSGGHLTLGAATKEYLARKEASGLGRSQVEETDRLLGWLNQALGAERPVATITKHQLRGFRDDLNGSLRSLANWLNENQVPGRGGGRWHPAMVGRVVGRLGSD